MDNTAQRTRQVIALMLKRGFLAPDHAMAVANNLLEAEPLPDAFALMGAGLIRQSVMLDPFDRDKIRLAEEINERINHRPFFLWLTKAKELTAKEPIPDNSPQPNCTAAPSEEIVAYMDIQTANAMRYPVMIELWQARRFDVFEQAVQTMSASPSGLLAAPTMAWGAYIGGNPFLAEMLLDEGVPNYLALNLRAQLAKDHQRTILLHASLEIEPFQPSTLLAINSEDHITDFHTTLGRRMRLSDLEKNGKDHIDPLISDFSKSLSEIFPFLPESVQNFWNVILPHLL